MIIWGLLPYLNEGKIIKQISDCRLCQLWINIECKNVNLPNDKTPQRSPGQGQCGAYTSFACLGNPFKWFNAASISFPFSLVVLFVIFVISETQSLIAREITNHRTPVFLFPKRPLVSLWIILFTLPMLNIIGRNRTEQWCTSSWYVNWTLFIQQQH